MNTCANKIVTKKTNKPWIRAGFCNTTSVSAWPKPPTFGLFVKAWSALTVSPTFTKSYGPGGIDVVTSSPLVALITTEYPPLPSIGAIDEIVPAAGEV